MADYFVDTNVFGRFLTKDDPAKAWLGVRRQEERRIRL
jgi:hypothetical protein